MSTIYEIHLCDTIKKMLFFAGIKYKPYSHSWAFFPPPLYNTILWHVQDFEK